MYWFMHVLDTCTSFWHQIPHVFWLYPNLYFPRHLFQRQGCHTDMVLHLAEMLVQDYCELVPSAESSLRHLPTLSQHFTSNFITAVTHIYSPFGMKLHTNNADFLLIRPSWTNCSEIWFKIQTFTFKNRQLKMLSSKWCFAPLCWLIEAKRRIYASVN